MNKIIFLMSFLLLLSCSSIEKKDELNDFSKSEIRKSIYIIQDEILNLVKLNEKEKIKEKVADTFRNRIMFKIIQNYDLNNSLIFFSKEVDIIDYNKAESLLFINFGTYSQYFKLNWKKIDKDWKIYSVEAIE